MNKKSTLTLGLGKRRTSSNTKIIGKNKKRLVFKKTQKKFSVQKKTKIVANFKKKSMLTMGIPESKPKKISPPLPIPAKVKAKELDQLLAQTFQIWNDFKALRVGVKESVLLFNVSLDEPYSKRVVQKAIRKHVHATKYLNSMVLADPRYDLEGKEEGEITAEAMAYCQKILAHKTKKREEI